MLELLVRGWWRHAEADRGYTVVNVAGLAIGLACCLAVGVYVDSELRYDHQFPDAERVVRLSAVISGPAEDQSRDGHSEDRRNAALTAQVYNHLDELSQVELSGRIFPVSGTARVIVGDSSTNELGVARVDPEILELFAPTFLAGDARTALSAPDSAVLTRSLATKLFGSEDPMGRTLEVYRSGELIVTGVIEDFPADCHLALRLLVPMSNLSPDFFLLRSWDHHYFHTYVRLSPGTEAADLAEPLRRLVERSAPPEVVESLVIEPIALTDIHLHSDFAREMKPQGTGDAVALFLAIAAVVLLVACINFTNLATARSARRAREIGLKRAFGVSRGRIVAELLAESVAFAALAVVLALVLVPLLLPEVSKLAAADPLTRPLAFDLFARPEWIAGLGLLAVVVGLVAGIYPAFYISAFQPAATLRGEVSRGRRGTRVRNGLVIVQFAVAVFLVAVTAITNRQMRWALDFDLGFNTEGVVYLSNVDDAEIDYETFAELLLKNPYIRSVTATSDHLGDHWPGADGGVLRIPENPESVFAPAMLGVAPGFSSAFGVDLIAGRRLSADRGEDRGTPRGADRGDVPLSVLVSRKAAHDLGLSPEEAVGRDLRGEEGGPAYRIVGVIEDLYLASVFEPIQPLLVFNDPQNYNVVAIAVEKDNLSATLAYIDRMWDAMSPQMPILRSFLDQDLHALYQREERQIKLFERFALLALLVACLGLLGLAAYATELRVREIGVRKVFGASAFDILMLLNRGFLALVLVGAAVATPWVRWFSQGWLERFAYRVEPGWQEIAMGAALVAAVALTVVSSRVIAAAIARPVKSLRYE